jgi:hypothetical protein
MPSWKKVIISGSDAVLKSLTVTSGSTVTGSFNVSGSTTQIGNNTLAGNTTLTGSIIISGSAPPNTATASIQIYGNTEQTGYLRFLPVTTNIDTSISASYIYVSGSTNDLYFSQNGAGYNNVTRLRWLEGNLYTGLLNGGLITTQSSTVYQIGSGSGIIVNLNASFNENPYPTVQYLNWGNLSASISAFTSSYQQAFVGIDSTNNIYAQGTPFNNGQFDTIINIGNVLFQNGSTINGVKTQPSVAYGFEQAQNIFNRAFGPLKLSGYTLSPSGSSTGSLIVASGTAYAPGSNYTVNPNEPSYTVDNGTTTSKIFRYRQSGSTWVYDTNGGAGYTTIDPTQYSNNGVLTSVPGGGSNRQWSIQRVFWFPNSVTKAIVVYYGNAIYPTEVEAIANISFESFVEAPNTAANAIYLGAIVVRNNANFTDSTSYKIQPGGLFRQVGGSGGGGSVVTQTLSGLSDVSISGPTEGQPLVYNASTLKWVNSSSLTATLVGNADTATTASYALTSSYVINAISASYAATASYVLNAISASFASTASYVLNAVSSSFATSASYALSASSALNAVSASYAPDTTFPYTGSARITGSLAVTGSVNASSFTGSLLGTASYATNALSSSYAVTASYVLNAVSSSFATSASYALSASSAVNAVTASYVLNAISASFATSASYALSASSALNAISASYAPDTTFPYTGSARITGSLAVTGSVNATSFTGSLLGTASYASQALSSSYAVTASYVLNAVSASFATSASYALSASSAVNAVTASYVLNAVSASFASTASYVNPLNQNVTITGSLTVITGSNIEFQVLNTGVNIGNVISDIHNVTGSLRVSGSITGSLLGTASYATNALSSSYALSASFAPASNPFPFTGSAIITGSLIVTGSTFFKGDAYHSGSLYVTASANSTTIGQFVGSRDSYIEFSVRNTSASLSASTDIAAYADNGNATANYIDMGINSSIYGGAPYDGIFLGRANDSYLFNDGGNLYIGNANNTTASGSLFLFAHPSGGSTGFGITVTGSRVGINKTGSISASLDVLGTTRISGSFNTAISGSILTVYGSGSANPVFTVQGSQGELFSITDSLSGSLFSVNDISGLPILEVFSDSTTLIGNYQAPALYTTVKLSSISGSNVIYSLPTGSYDGVFVDYTLKSGSNARAGQVMGIWSGSSANYTDNSTTDFGNTAGFAFAVIVSGSNMVVTGSSTTAGWTVKTIIRSI